MNILTPSFLKRSNFQNAFRLRKNEKKTKIRRFSNSSDLKGVFEKLRFRNGLVWTVSLAIEIKLRFDLYST